MIAFIITIHPEGKKCKRLIRQLEHLGLEIVVYFGVIPSDNYENLIEKSTFLKKYGRLPSKGEVGCALSHMAIYEEIISRKLTSALVFEDDAVLLPSFASILQEYEYIFQKLDLVSLYTEGAFLKTGANDLVRPAHFMCDNTVAYWITKKGAKLLLSTRNQAQKICGLADWPAPPQKLNLHVLCKDIVMHDTSSSSIETSRNTKKSTLSIYSPYKYRRYLMFWMHYFTTFFCGLYRSQRPGLIE